MSFLVVTVFVDLLGFGMVLPLLPHYLAGAAEARTAVGTAIALYSLGQFLGLPVLGVLSDRLGRKPVLVSGLLLVAAAYLLLALSRSAAMVHAAIALGGLASGTTLTAQAVVADSSEGAERTRRLGILSIGYGAGVTLGPLIGGALGAIALPLPPLCAAALAVTNVLVGGRALSGLSADRRDPEAEPIRLRELLPLAVLGRMLRMAALRVPYASVFLLNVSTSVLPATVAVEAVQRFQWSPLQSGLLFGVVGLCAVVTQVTLLPMLRRRSEERTILIRVLPLAGLVLIPAIWLTRGWPLFPILALYAVCSSLAVPCLIALVTRASSSSSHGASLAGMNAMSSVAAVLSPLAAAFLSLRVQVRSPWIVASAAPVAAALLLHLSRPRPGRSSPPQEPDRPQP